MIHRLLLIGACLICLAPPSYAVDTPKATEENTLTVGSMPARGMTMPQVEQYFGAPQQKIDAVGRPPISRWVYEGFIVYFEGQHVIHALATSEASE
ncbi:MAG: hypothetical protein HY272_14670 [Gammaproteobacteria bacterium]|nr:hypothetical protein [Gammaproteobacteria bacterium]